MKNRKVSRLRAERKRAERRQRVKDSRRPSAKGPKMRGAAHIPSSMDYTRPYENWERVFGDALDRGAFLRSVRNWPWTTSFYRLAELSAFLANQQFDCEAVKQKTVDPLLLVKCPTSAVSEHVRRALQSRRSSMVVAHEEVILWLQHLVLIEGAASEGLVDQDAVPDHVMCTWLLAGNTLLGKHHAHAEPSSDNLSARVVKVLRFNNRPDPARLLARTKILFETRPPRSNELQAEEAWKRLQTAAFGTSFEEYFLTVLGPLYMLSQGWGTNESPVIDLRKFVSETKVPAESFEVLLKTLSSTRDELAASVKRDQDGLPLHPVALLHRPLVQVEGCQFIGSSPWQLRNQLHTGLWGKYRDGAKKVFGDKRGAEVWLHAFGDMVEGYCRLVANEAAKTCTRATFVMSEGIGDHTEVEDIVVVEDDSVLLFSVKGSMMTESASRTAATAAPTISWWERFLFAPKARRHPAGALRLLNDRLRRIRAGAFEKVGIPMDAHVYPIVVTYDSLGEHDLLYRKIEQRRRDEGLLQGRRVAAPILGDVEDFEVLMGRLSHGHSAVEVLSRRIGKGAQRRLDQLLAESTPAGPRRRLEFLERSYRQVVDQIHLRLFGCLPEKGGP